MRSTPEEADSQDGYRDFLPLPFKMKPHTPMRWVYWLGWMAFGAAFRTLFSLRVIGEENLVTEGPVLVASNHQSFLDPPLIGNLYKTEMVFLARKTLFVGFFKWLYPQWNAIPVDQERPDMAALKRSSGSSRKVTGSSSSRKVPERSMAALARLHPASV